jgi:plasmid rolling circle replication initiator protein Rep
MTINVWDKHKINAKKAAKYYSKSKNFERYSQRIILCCQALNLDINEGVTRFCRVRNCSICQWRRALKWKAKAYKVLPNFVDEYPTYRWLFITLTVRNCPITELRETLVWMNKSWQRFIQLKSFPAIGWLRSTEVTRGKDGSAHPHFHCLLMVAPGYFGKNYLKQAEWVDMWRRSLRIDYNPEMNIQPIAKDQNLKELIPGLVRYCTKEAELVDDIDWFLELTSQVHNTRAIATGGILKAYLAEAEEEVQ